MPQFQDNLDYAYASRFKKEISKLFSGNEYITIDLRNTERASAACMQILVAAHKKAQKDGLQLIIDPSNSMKEIIEDLGLSTILSSKGDT